MRDSFDINIKGKRRVGEKAGREKEVYEKKTKSGWAHHISTQPLLYVIHDRRLLADTLKGSQTAAGGQQCHNVKITPTKNIMNITFLNGLQMQNNEGKLIEMNFCEDCVRYAREYGRHLWNNSCVTTTIFH